MMIYFLVSLGGALGSMARFWLSGVTAARIGETFPWGTLVINVTGSFVIGFFVTLTGPEGRVFASSYTRQFVIFGLCGGYTTFSAFSLQTLSLAREGQWWQAGGNIIGSVLTCLIAVWLGHLLAAYLNTQRGI